MQASPLDGAAKAFAQTSTRGQALRVLAGGMFGAALLFGRPGRALAGASDSRDDHGDKDKGKKCSRNTDCPSGQVCLDGACFSGTCSTCGTANTRCATNVDCCNGLICVNGACFSGTCTPTGGGGGCTSAATCPQPAAGSCHTATCTNGVCGFANNAAGSACTGGTCDGNGTCVTAQCTTPAQCPPAAAGSCHTATCIGGVCGFTNNVAGSACTGGTCDGAGTCVTAQCTNASQCPPAAAGSCKTATCNGGVCGFAADPTNLPVCGTCMTAVCVNGVPSCTNNAAGSACPGGTCDGAGTCVTAQCTTPAQCQQAAVGSCKKATCIGGVCGMAVDDTNLPNCGPCTTAVCVNGVPSCVNSAVGTTCNNNGGIVCNGAGQCVECVTSSTCPAGGDPICATSTCTNGVCGTHFAAVGTVCGFQLHCDGAGSCV